MMKGDGNRHRHDSPLRRIGGSGMSGNRRVMHQLGYKVQARTSPTAMSSKSSARPNPGQHRPFDRQSRRRRGRRLFDGDQGQ